ncbi:Flagellar hook-length control protein FliK [Gemmata obscuriglobus]|uniref:Flagellar hook-length control protein FliK n=1 Tax=Gemmata obscuriglobus TaxID=114 RepID=A0A2Z3H114_9BACT|nr:flagellar hook-length control protein FliK [Gemmata obscuriglobus]AWM37266.1 flagellar hook-length control protein FliK [Gemmata obscuriglobus]QEG29991.1 Flagellar hook-length control protein FliK [Gemmata obscuriglobus]VTS09309.1 Flagellar hook-length control protein OS=Polaromonas sp. CF318 GN=PMI15_00756 PE=4 SV=1: Flg_hook [Gemmata obscuriglobus UQM 2246]
MATAVSSVTSAGVATQATGSSGPRETTSSTPTDPFQTILTQTTTATRDPQQVRETNQTAANTQAANQAAADQVEEDQRESAEAASDAAAAILAAQLGLTQLAAANTPISTDGTPLATSQTATDAQRLTAPEFSAAQQPGQPTQTNPLLRQAIADASRQNRAPAPGAVPQTTPPADAVPAAQPAATAPSPTTVPLPTASTPQPAQAAGLAAATAAVESGQRQVVPAQAPIVSGLLPAQPAAPVTEAALPAPVTAPTAPVEAPAVPSASVGDRPNTAGDRFAAIASTATTLLPSDAAAPTTPLLSAAPAVPTVPTAFTQVLAGTDAANALTASNTAVKLAPSPLAEPTDRWAGTRAADDAVPTFGAPAPVPQSPNAVTAAQTPTAVKTPDPVVQVADHIVTHAHVVARGGETEFQMRLDPPELGALKIRLVSDGDSIHGQVVVSSDAVRRMIESQLPELRQRLEDAGVSVQNFSVATDANAQAGTGGGEWGGYRSEFPAELPRQSAVPTGARPVPARASGAIDVMA